MVSMMLAGVNAAVLAPALCSPVLIALSAAGAQRTARFLSGVQARLVPCSTASGLVAGKAQAEHKADLGTAPL